jgi:hypothetical protein
VPNPLIGEGIVRAARENQPQTPPRLRRPPKKTKENGQRRSLHSFRLKFYFMPTSMRIRLLLQLTQILAGQCGGATVSQHPIPTFPDLRFQVRQFLLLGLYGQRQIFSQIHVVDHTKA